MGSITERLAHFAQRTKALLQPTEFPYTADELQKAFRIVNSGASEQDVEEYLLKQEIGYRELYPDPQESQSLIDRLRSTPQGHIKDRIQIEWTMKLSKWNKLRETSSQPSLKPKYR